MSAGTRCRLSQMGRALRTIEGPYVYIRQTVLEGGVQALLMGVRHFARASHASFGVRSAKEREV